MSSRIRLFVAGILCAVLVCGAACAEGAPEASAPADRASEGKTDPKKAPSRGVRHARNERGEMTADRPELSVSSRTVPKGRAQLEMEVELEGETEGDESIQRWIAPSALVRFGLSEDLELRAASNLLVFQGSQSGLANATVGLKWNFVKGDPSLGLLVQSTLPVGNPALRVDHPRYQAAFLADVPLGRSFELRFNAGAAVLVRDEKWEIDPTASVAIFTHLGRHVELHVEYGHLGALRLHGGPAHLADAGIAYIIDEDTQVDLAGFKGLSGETFDWKVALGFARRF